MAIARKMHLKLMKSLLPLPTFIMFKEVFSLPGIVFIFIEIAIRNGNEREKKKNQEDV